MTYPDPAVDALLATQFVAVRIDSAARREIARAHQIFWNPTLVILHHHGLRLREIVGYLPPRLLMPELLVARGLFDIRRGRPGQAAATFARVRAEHPDAPVVPESLYWLGVVASWHHDDKALLRSAWRELVEGYPQSLWAAKTMLLEE